jgi:hypothetical protein
MTPCYAPAGRMPSIRWLPSAVLYATFWETNGRPSKSTSSTPPGADHRAARAYAQAFHAPVFFGQNLNRLVIDNRTLCRAGISSETHPKEEARPRPRTRSPRSGAALRGCGSQPEPDPGDLRLRPGDALALAPRPLLLLLAAGRSSHGAGPEVAWRRRHLSLGQAQLW